MEISLSETEMILRDIKTDISPGEDGMLLEVTI